MILIASGTFYALKYLNKLFLNYHEFVSILQLKKKGAPMQNILIGCQIYSIRII